MKLHRGRLGMDQQFHPTLYWACDYLSILELTWTMLVKGVQESKNHVYISWYALYTNTCGLSDYNNNGDDKDCDVTLVMTS